MRPFRHRGALALAAAAALAARAGGAVVADPRFGVMTHFAQGWPASEAALLEAGGIPTVRDEVYWKEVEPSPGRFRFPAADDRYLEALRRAGIAPLIVLDFENPNYDGGNTPWSDGAIAAYARYAVAVLRRYPQVRAVEIWNEYNGTFCKGPATRDRAGAYLRLLKAAHDAIKRERPDVLIAGGATSGVPLPYWDKLLQGGALGWVDALSIHPYRYEEEPEGIEDDVAALQALARRRGGAEKPIWVTEIGWDLRPATAPGDLAIGEREQADFLARAYALLLSAGVGRIYWYEFQDGEGLRMGLRRESPGLAAKPAFAALRTTVAQLRGARFVRREATAGEFYSLLFVRPSGEEVRVVWSLRPAALGISPEARAVDVAGRARPDGTALEAGPSPLFVSGPLGGLPPPEPGRPRLLADSARDFSSFQGENGWSYGAAVEGSPFLPLPTLQTTDWKDSWAGSYPYLMIAAKEQHPSAADGKPVAAVRRWVSNYEGTVRIAGEFRCGLQGDGVGASVLIDGRRVFRAELGGGGGRPVARDFSLVQSVHPGTCVDFAVDPGPAANIDFDATAVRATVSAVQP